MHFTGSFYVLYYFFLYSYSRTVNVQLRATDVNFDNSSSYFSQYVIC